MQKLNFILLLVPLTFVVCAATFASRLTLMANVPVRWVTVPNVPTELALFESVFWEPLDTLSLRKMLVNRPELVRGKRVLEIGTGSGVIAICCRMVGATSVTATDINPNAIACARRNAIRAASDIDFRLVPSGRDVDSSAYSVMDATETFDVIISNPPWENGTPKAWSDYALYDPNFALLRSILTGCRQHLKPGGKLLLAYGCGEAIRVARQLATELELNVVVLDDRDPNSLPDVFLPGMLLGVTP